MNAHKWFIYTICGLFLLSGVFCIILLFYTSIENVSAKSLEEKITECKKQVEQLSKEAATLSDWNNINEYFDQFKDEYLMKMEEFSKFRDELRMTFNKYGLMNKRVEHSYKGVFDYIKVGVSFSVEGTYPNIKRFIHEMLNRKEMILIKRIKLKKDQQKGVIAGNFNMEVYLVK